MRITILLIALALTGCQSMFEQYSADYELYTNKFSTCLNDQSNYVRVPQANAEPIEINFPNIMCMLMEKPKHPVQVATPFGIAALSGGFLLLSQYYADDHEFRIVKENNSQQRFLSQQHNDVTMGYLDTIQGISGNSSMFTQSLLDQQGTLIDSVLDSAAPVTQ